MYALITHKNRDENLIENETVWYIGIVENHKAKPIPEVEAEKICTLLNAIIQVPEKNFKALLDGLKLIASHSEIDKWRGYEKVKRLFSM